MPEGSTLPQTESLTVVVQTATFNEAATIASLLTSIGDVLPGAHMLVIDDESPDGTGAIVAGMAATNPQIHLLHRHSQRGLGSAILDGLRFARDLKADVSVYLDADFSHDPADIPRLLAALQSAAPDEAPYDIAIGSRRVPGGRTLGWPPTRHLASWLVCGFTRWILGVPVKDASGGFRAVRLSCLDSLDLAGIAEGYAFQEDFLWRAHRAGVRMIEVPITFTNRTEGNSKADFAEMLRSVAALLRIAWKTWIGH
jgi:dolichol-phosphate mannosyltransferase